MGGTAMDVLPGDVELARRAAGGDGAAFVHLYDRHSADVFEAVLGATASVDTASAATQDAFLRLLGRPPALGAPDADVAERLQALAVRAGVDGVTPIRPLPAGKQAGRDAPVGWLRSETVAKAAARFDADWSTHLARDTARPARVQREDPLPPLVVPAAAATAAPAARAAERSPAAAAIAAPAARAAERTPAPVPDWPAPSAARRPRRPFIATLEGLPLRRAGIVVLLIAAATLGAAAMRLSSEESGGATEAAVAAPQGAPAAAKRAGARGTRLASRYGAHRRGGKRRHGGGASFSLGLNALDLPFLHGGGDQLAMRGTRGGARSRGGAGTRGPAGGSGPARGRLSPMRTGGRNPGSQRVLGRNRSGAPAPQNAPSGGATPAPETQQTPASTPSPPASDPAPPPREKPEHKEPATQEPAAAPPATETAPPPSGNARGHHKERAPKNEDDGDTGD